MGLTDWSIRGPSFGNCNCDWGCPCQFNALPTHGDCRAMSAVRIEEGHFGGVRLDGLTLILTVAWPGPIHEGDGTAQLIVDERADERQREGLIAIGHGRETAEGATAFQVFNSTCSHQLDPLFRPIQFECNIEQRLARVVVDGLLESTGEPIRNPVTGDEHRVRVEMPEGFEYTVAEYGSANTRGTGGVPLDFSGSYAQFHMLHWTQNGVVR